MRQYYYSLILLLLVTGISSFTYGSEQPGLVSQSVYRKRSPLAYESLIAAAPDIIGQEEEELDENEMQAISPMVCEPLRISTMTRMRHRANSYEIILQLAPISKWNATAVINPYSRSGGQSKVSLDLYKKCGREFVSQLKSLYTDSPALFAELGKQPGNSLLLSSDCFPLGSLNMDVMAFMYVPEVVKPKTKGQVLARLSNGISNILINKLYPLLERSNIVEASVVMPAIGADPIFYGYSGPLVAKMVLSTVVTTLRYLHGLGRSRLKYAAFVIDNQEAYENYQTAFNKFFHDEHDYFTRLETPTDIENWS
jgi:hypothetical protein